MTAARLSIEEAPFRAFHGRLAVYSCGGPFCDGYILGIIALVLPFVARDFNLSAGWEGGIAAASLIGMFIGGAIFGYLTDVWGRKLMYTLDLAFFVVGSIAQFWVDSAWWLFALRFLLGIAIGADYPIVSALVAEFAPRKRRGMLLAGMVGAWWFGYTVSFLASAAFLYADGSNWRWILASSAIPAIIVTVLRSGMPESPRWLASKGRMAEAQAIIDKHIGPEYRVDENPGTGNDYRRIFAGPYLGRTAFVSAFWAIQAATSFSIYTFAPDLMKALNVQDSATGSALMSIFFMIGVIPAIMLIDRIGRRPLLIIPFAVTGLVLVGLVFAPQSSVLFVSLGFIIFALFSAASSVLQWIYPSELFPTEIRATALGFTTAMSRIGAALGTFVVPLIMERFGIDMLLIIFAGLCAVGWIISIAWAPETRGLPLDRASCA